MHILVREVLRRFKATMGFPPLLKGIAEGTTVYADKGYDSKENRQHLKEHRLLDGIMRKACHQISSFIFEKLNAAGVATHFVDKLSDTEQLNKKVEIIPLEVVLRNYTAGSFSKRFGVKEGIAFETPIVEFYYKNDDLDDPFINDEHVKFLKIADDQQIAYLKEETRRINELLKAWFAEIGLKLIDFKLEFGFDKDDKIILADEFSPDNCRLWDADGNHMDKDVLQRDRKSVV